MSSQKRIIETFTEMALEYESIVDSELDRFWGWRYSDFVEHLISLTPIKSNDRVLDVATGTGLIPRKISKLIDSNIPIHGLDITPAMIEKAQEKIKKETLDHDICFVTASAMSMPYPNEVFDVLFCGLATHHMDVHEMLAEMSRVLRKKGELSMADVGGSSLWKLPGIRFIIKVAAFVYYSLQENIRRAWAEAQGVTNIRSPEEWQGLLHENGFEEITVVRLRSKHFWFPQPLLIRASKIHR